MFQKAFNSSDWVGCLEFIDIIFQARNVLNEIVIAVFHRENLTSYLNTCKSTKFNMVFRKRLLSFEIEIYS